MSEKTNTQPKLLDKVRNEMREDIFINMGRETALNNPLANGQNVVLHLSRLFRDNTILPANERIDFTKFIILFFCSFTDKILNSWVLNRYNL